MMGNLNSTPISFLKKNCHGPGRLPSTRIKQRRPRNRSDYLCRKCRAHGLKSRVKQHKKFCPYLNCLCLACRMVDRSRRVVAKQIALYRDQKHHVPPELEAVKAEKIEAAVVTQADAACCRKCRNHGFYAEWKSHKKVCPYRKCSCEGCGLISERKRTEKALRDLTHQDPPSVSSIMSRSQQQPMQASELPASWNWRHWNSGYSGGSVYPSAAYSSLPVSHVLSADLMNPSNSMCSYQEQQGRSMRSACAHATAPCTLPYF